MKLIPDSVANALAVNVLLHPGGPYNRIPLGGATPNLVNVSGCVRGHSTHSLSFCLTTACPPISDHRTFGVSMKTSRMAEGRMVGSAVCRSAVVIVGEVVGEEDWIQRWMAIEPASRTSEDRSAPT